MGLPLVSGLEPPDIVVCLVLEIVISPLLVVKVALCGDSPPAHRSR